MRDAARWFANLLPPNVVEKSRDIATLASVVKDRAIANFTLDVAAKPNSDVAATKAALTAALAAAAKVAQHGDKAKLEPDEEAALELFVLLVARPAMFVKKDKPVGSADNWPEIARDRALFPQIAAGVGRLQRADGARIGSGFIVGELRVVTNNHVVCGLLGEQAAFWRHMPAEFAAACDAASALWREDEGAQPVFELRGELESAETSATRVVSIKSHHPTADVAVLEIASMPAGARRVKLATAELDGFEKRRYYAVGHPIDDVRDYWGGRITPAPIFMRIFGADDTTLGTKRFSPGTVTGWDEETVFLHDMSTLPGSSGSCIVDFETRQVVGLHFAGSFELKRNLAVPLWKFQDVLAKDGVVF